MRDATLVLADTHQLFLQGLRLLVESRANLTVLQTVTNGFEALESCRQLGPDILLVDSAIPGLDPLAICTELARFSSRTRVVLTLPFVQHERVAQAIQAGAAGVVLKNAPAEQLHSILDDVLAGQTRFPAQLKPARGVSGRPEQTGEVQTPYSRLTARERMVFKLLVEGHSVKQVASRLELKPKTVDVHKTNLMRKLDVHDRSELIHFAFREGLVNLGAAATA